MQRPPLCYAAPPPPVNEYSAVSKNSISDSLLNCIKPTQPLK
jgi:hypothetical protein